MYHPHMTKEEAKNIFGKRYIHLAKAMGYAPSTVCEWPAELSEQRTNEVIGCAMRNGLPIPPDLLNIPPLTGR